MTTFDRIMALLEQSCPQLTKAELRQLTRDVLEAVARFDNEAYRVPDPYALARKEG